MLKSVEAKLQDVAKSLKRAWDLRQVETSLLKALLKAFGKPLCDTNDATVLLDDALDFLPQMLQNLDEVLEFLPPRQAETFSSHDCLNGYLEWNKFWASKMYEKDPPLKNIHVIYEKWVKQFPRDHAEFRRLFEICMIRTMSEAMAETVGSMMTGHCGKGRHLQPNYFSMELVLRFNLGPLHLLEGLIKDVFESEKKEYRRKDVRNRFVTSDSNVSAAVQTYRKSAENVSRLPIQFWSQWKA